MEMEILEKFLSENILPDLAKGRPNDVPHTLLVVKMIKNIVTDSPELKLDLEVLIIAAYAHDWGYTDLLDPTIKIRLEHLGELKETHMKVGAEKLSKLLESRFFDHLTEDRKKRAIHLVGVHDKLDALKDVDEIVIMEADSLGGMDPDVMGIFGDKDSEERYMKKSRELRLTKFITPYSKNMFEKLYLKRLKLKTA
ncbi:MAG: HD domain-containing protein [Microgenomates group bacterium]